MSASKLPLTLPPEEAAQFLAAIHGKLSIGLRNDSTREWRLITASHTAEGRQLALEVAHRAAYLAGPDWSVHVRPLPSEAGNVFAVCLDLDAAPPARLTALGLAPAAVVETSPGRYQAWLNFPGGVQAREPDTLWGLIPGSILMAGLVEATGADPGGRQATHAGRVPGYANSKPEHPEARCRLIEATGAEVDSEPLLRVFAQARDQAIAERIEQQRRMAAAAERPVFLARAGYPPKTPESFYARESNHSAADMAYAVYARDRMGLSELDVDGEIIRARTAIGEVALKGGREGLRGYAHFTAHKAFMDARYQRRSDEYER